MARRNQFIPGLNDTYVSLEDLLEHLRLWQSDARERVEALAAYQAQVHENAAKLESPKAAGDYIAFFVDFFTRAADELQRIEAELPAGLQQAHLDALRQLASNAAAESRRCVMFRDKWINRPLPYEQVRPFLNQLSIDTRDQLADFRELKTAADRLAALAGPGDIKPPAPGTLDRRAMFNRLLGRE
jgi:DNA-binding transcriptional MerR regulator